ISSDLTQCYDDEETPPPDPKTLCPYCDTPLPAKPTHILKKLLDRTYFQSCSNPRPGNRLGRKAPSAIFGVVCQRHIFESNVLPQAKERGWPTQINWATLKDRVLHMERELAKILADPGDPVVYRGDGKEDNDAKEQQGSKPERSDGPRMRCLFWDDLVKRVKTQGSKGLRNITSQYYNFHKMQPGYYGELGLVIIQRALCGMFPLEDIDPGLVKPLTPMEFIQSIFVPEVGMRLVMADFGLNVNNWSDKEQAVEVLRDSASYGVAMFPYEESTGK
ncbi:RTC4-like domain-containing protein, partial [Mycena rosella]